MHRVLGGTEEGRNWIEESEARIGDYLESNIRDGHGDREHEAEDKAKEGTATSAADPAGPLASGEAATDSSKSTSKEDGRQPHHAIGHNSGPDSCPKKPEKKARIATDDASKVQKRDRDQECEKRENTARQDGMTDVSTPGASSSSIVVAPSIPIGPSTGHAVKR